MTYLTNFTGGRLANQLYFVLQAYCKSKRNNKQFKYVQMHAQTIYTDLTQYVDKLNISSYFCKYSNSIKNDDILIQPYNQYYQYIHTDFTEDELIGFINDTILKSDYFKSLKNKIEDYETTCAIHIRNGDFLKLNIYNCFDRFEYLKNAINNIPYSIRTVRVFSDDIEKCKQYDKILKTHFDNIIFEVNQSQLDDFYKLSCYRYKVLWNSTFSYWSGFITDVLYNNKTQILCPKMTLVNEDANLRCKKNWIKI